MRVVESRLIELSKIVAAEDFQRMLDQRAVTAVVHLLRLHRDPGHPIVLRARDKRIITGEDVLAAHIVVGSHSAKATLIECDEDEFRALRVADQSRIMLGRAVTDKALDELVTLLEGRVDEVVPKDRRRRKAQELVAELVGVTPDALRKRDERRAPFARKPRQRKTAEEFDLQVYGNHAPAKLKVEAELANRTLGAIASSATHLVGLATRLTETRLNPATVERLRELGRTLSALAREQQPTHLCPYCKDIAVVRETCAGCWGAGYVGERVFNSAPAELRKFPCVAYGGQYVDAKLKPFKFPPPQAVAHIEDGYEDDDQDKLARAWGE